MAGALAAGAALSVACAHPAAHGRHGAERRPPVSAAPARVPAYANPVIDRNFPDPSVLNDRGTYYAYATNSGPNMLCARSADLIHWTALPDAMPTLPAWANPGLTWAPNVRAAVPGRRYVAYFTARCRATNEQALGVAVSARPDGPFTSASPSPLVDQQDAGGSIDPSCFIDTDGARFLVWKNDGNSRGADTWIWIQRLSDDGLSLRGTPTRLIRQDQPWEGPLIEAPTLWMHTGRYFLFYSANGFNTDNYAVGYAVAASVLGPYVKPRRTPWLSSTTAGSGPGGEDIVAARDGSTWMAYHAWAKGPNSYRSMSINPLVWDGDIPRLLAPPSPEVPPHGSH